MRPVRLHGKFLCLDGLRHEWLVPICKTILHTLRVYFSTKKLKKEIIKKWLQPAIFEQRSYEPKITWIGHATFLIQVGGKNILTDPIFGSLSFIFRRLIPAAIAIADLPPIDYILISHNHYDHMNSASLHELHQRFPQVKVLVPMGDKKWFDKHAFVGTAEHMWWDETIDEAIADLKFTFLPANHWSQRTLFDKNSSLWGSWMIQFQNFKVYFAGDTSWGNHFEQIGKEFSDIDIACLPIAPGEPEWMKDTHINAQEAVQAFIKLRAKTFVPMHWGTFDLGFDDFYTPLNFLKQSWQKFAVALQYKELKILKFGQSMQVMRQKIWYGTKTLVQDQVL